MRKYLLILLSTFVFAQTNTATIGTLKLNNTPATSTTNTKGLVRNPTTKLVEEQLFAHPVPSWDQTLTLNSTAQQNATINDPYNLYLRSGHLKLWHNIDADYADISIGSGYWKFNNSQFQDFEITPQGFSTFKYGLHQAFFDNSALTADVDLGIPNVNGTLLTTYGTESGKPIAGDIEFGAGDLRMHKTITADDYELNIFFGDGLIDISSKLISTDEITSLMITNGGINIDSQIAGFRGLSSKQDYSANVTTLDFPQVSYIDKRFAGYSQTGTGLGGDLIVSIGDVNADYNATKMVVDDSENTISLIGSVTVSAEISFRGPTGANYANLVNDSDVSRALTLPISPGRLALESKSISKTTAQINALTGVQAGDHYFNTTLGTLCFYDGAAWKRVSHSAM